MDATRAISSWSIAQVRPFSLESTYGSFMGSSTYREAIREAETCISTSFSGPSATVSGPRLLRRASLSRYCPLCSLTTSPLFSSHPHPPREFHFRPARRRPSTPTLPRLVHATDYLTHRASLGGGIIDMMNRRLRERLTEAEILQIFVDVCEGVAAMHNLRPALLHRDLKVYPPSIRSCSWSMSPFTG